jgi:CRP/FNR family transcriptional regulator
LDKFLDQQEDQANSLYFVRSGSSRSLIWDKEGGEQTIGFCLPGELIGLAALQNNDHYHWPVITRETATVCNLPLSGLNKLYTTVSRQLGYLIKRGAISVKSSPFKSVIGVC